MPMRSPTGSEVRMCDTVGAPWTGSVGPLRRLSRPRACGEAGSSYVADDLARRRRAELGRRERVLERADDALAIDDEGERLGRQVPLVDPDVHSARRVVVLVDLDVDEPDSGSSQAASARRRRRRRPGRRCGSGRTAASRTRRRTAPSQRSPPSPSARRARDSACGRWSAARDRRRWSGASGVAEGSPDRRRRAPRSSCRRGCSRTPGSACRRGSAMYQYLPGPGRRTRGDVEVLRVGGLAAGHADRLERGDGLRERASP